MSPRGESEMPRAYPEEFRQSIHGAPRQECDRSVKSRRTGHRQSALRRWVRQADLDDGQRRLLGHSRHQEHAG